MNSIRLRLLGSLLATLSLAALVLGAATYRSALQEAEALFDYQLRQMALSLRDQGEIAPDQASALHDASLDFVIQIWSVDGRAIYASRAHSELPARAVLGFADLRVGNETWRTFGVAAGERVIQVAQPRQIRERLAANAAFRNVLPLLLSAPLLAAALWVIVTRVLAPLKRVSHEVRSRDAGSLQPLQQVVERLHQRRHLVGQALRGQRLSVAIDAQRAFVADAAHELRSPLTALKLQVQLLQRAPDEAARDEAQQLLAQGVERATRLVGQLLTLARNEPGAPLPPLQSVDLGEAVRQGLSDLGTLAAARGSTLQVEAPVGVEVKGDIAGLSALARNLADNALRYSPPGATVRVQVARDEAAPVLTVDDSGPGLAPEERARAFDRFWRREDSAGLTEGSGLGLAIVRSIAERHGATLALEESPLGGLRVRLRFPRP
jgi:two-component system OmpR family sensor kinase/two-component system sensor histidine kinase QseC